MRGKIAFMILWTPLMGLSVWWLFFQKSQNTSSGTPIARVTEQVGDIQYRQDDDILWHNAENNQYVFENDNIATGPNSYASINFGNSRTIELGPHTQIRIRPMNKVGQEFELDLLRGQVAARPGSENDRNVKGSKKAMQLRIFSGKESFALKRQAELVLKKDRDQETGNVVFANGQISHQGTTGTKDIKVDGEKISFVDQVHDGIEIKSTPTPEPEPKPVPKIVIKKTPIPTPLPPPLPAPTPPPVPEKPLVEPTVALTAPREKGIDFLPVMLFPPPHNIVWSTSSWRDLLERPLQLVMEPPQKKPEVAWQPVIASSTKDQPEKRVFVLQGQAEFRRQFLGLKLDRMRERGFLRQESSEEEYQIELAAGARLKDENGIDEAATAPRLIRIRSALSLPKSRKAGLKIRMAQLAPQSKLVPWFVTPETFKETSSLYIKGTDDLSRLQMLLQGSQGFSVESSADEIRGKGIFIVRDLAVMGKIDGQLGGQKDLDRVRSMLKAEAIYRGSATAYIGGLTQFKERALAKKLPQKIYILHDGRFIGVNRDFMKTNPTLRRFLEQKTSAFFTEPIEILSAENFTTNPISH